MQVSVTKTATGYTVQIGDKSVTLPLDSNHTEDRKRGVSLYGTDSMRLEINPYSNEIDFVKGKDEPSESILSEDDADDEEREKVVSDLSSAWADRDKADSDPEGGRRRSRVNRKTRRSKGKRRNTKRRQFRNLTSRRR